MKEEAILRGGAGSSGVSSDDFQKMLKRSFAYDANPLAAFEAAYGNVSAWTVDDILDERGREFAWECVRRRDLIRFGKFADNTYIDYVTAKDKYREWFPIPYSVLEKSKINEETGERYWKQNEGYQDI
jgi:hypothetical protein